MNQFKKILSVITIVALTVIITGGTYIEGQAPDISSDEQIIKTDANNTIPDYTIFGVTVHGEDIDFSEISLINYKGQYLIPLRLLANETNFNINYDPSINQVYLSKLKNNNIYEVIKFYPTDFNNIESNTNDFCQMALNINGQNREFVSIPMDISPVIINDIIYVPLENTAYLMGYQLQWKDTYVNLVDEYFIKIQYYIMNEKIKEVYGDVYDQYFFDYRFFENIDKSRVNKALGIKEETTVVLETSQAKFTYNVFEKSNLSVEQLNRILSNTGMAGQGHLFKEMENEYNINSLFCISVGCLESGNFTSSAFRNKNNPFGIGPGKYFNSPKEAINYFGRLMNKSTYYGKSIDKIGSIYCVGGNWANKVKALMKSNWNKI